MYSFLWLFSFSLILGYGFAVHAQQPRSSSASSRCTLPDDGDGHSGAGEPMIINGEAVPVGEAKYQLALLRGGVFICGASLIAPRTAITAGHCLHG